MVLTDSTRQDGARVPEGTAVVSGPVEHCPRVIYLTDLVPSGKFGSLEEQTLTLARAFAEQGSLYVPVFGGPVAPAVAEQYAANGLPVEGLDLNQLSTRTLLALLRMIRKYKVSVVHWNFYSPINPYVGLLSVFAPRLSHFVTDHTSRVLPLAPPAKGLKRLVKKLLFRRYRKVFCISDFVVDCLEQDGTWSNLVRCTHFINTDRFVPDSQSRIEMRSRFQAKGKFVVLFVGQLIRWKGIDVALRAMAELSPEVHLWIVGEGEERQKLEALRDELFLADRVRFLGSQNNVEPYMQAADCFVCPSLWGEATGLVNLEALASGLPVVASEIGGIPEFVADEQTGLLFPPGDHGRLAKQLDRLVKDPALHDRLSRAARETAVAEFSIGRRLPEYVRAYE